MKLKKFKHGAKCVCDYCYDQRILKQLKRSKAMKAIKKVAIFAVVILGYAGLMVLADSIGTASYSKYYSYNGTKNS